MRHYFDLHIRPSSSVQAFEMANLAHQLGYIDVASTKPPTGSNDKITVATRLDIEARWGKELVDSLKKYRLKVEVIAVRCYSKEVARQAAKDNRVDILLFPDDPAQRKYNWLDNHEAELVEGTGRAYEVNASDLLATSPTHLSKVITQLKRDLVVAMRHDIPIVLSSGATTPLAMREPKALTALASLLDIEEEYAVDMISKVPEMILKRNRSKLEEKGT